ncbi:MAG: ABC transporter substrate-binding protein [Oscillospiraceae bacterium]
MKKNTIAKVLALTLATTLVLSGCSGKPNDSGNGGDSTKPSTTDTKGGKPIKDLVIYKISSRELETFNMLYSQKAEDFENLTNIWDGLLEVDNKGKLVPCIAESWETSDSITWTFKIRKDVKWVDVKGDEKADCNAYDFATGLEWVLNFHKNDSNNTSMPVEMIKGAEEYYNYTKGLSPAEALALKAGEGSKFNEMVGCATPDANTVVYTCITPKPYFDTLGSYAALYPLSQKLVDELTPDGIKSMDNTKMWYNGCYTMTSYIQGNEKVFTKNPKYWDTNCTLFDTATFKMLESSDVAYQMYQSGDVDYVSLTEGNLKTIYENKDNKFHDYLIPDVAKKYSYQFHFNYDKCEADGTPDTNWNTAIANEAFRKAWFYGLNITEYNKRTDMINPTALQNNFYTMEGLIYTSDGKDYVELVREKLGLPAKDDTKIIRLNADKAAQYKAQAKEELSKLGVTFPVEIDHYIKSGDQTALDGATILKNCFSQYLGDDFVKLNINTYVSSLNKEVRTPKLQSFMINGWGADYGDPVNYLGQETIDNANAWYTTAYSNADKLEVTEATKQLLDYYKQYTELVNKADAITDNLDARYNAFAEAEAFMLEHVLVLPANYGRGWALGKIDNTSKMAAMFGCCNDKMKNWKTSVEGYTTEQAKSNAEALAASKK